MSLLPLKIQLGVWAALLAPQQVRDEPSCQRVSVRRKLRNVQTELAVVLLRKFVVQERKRVTDGPREQYLYIYYG